MKKVWLLLCVTLCALNTEAQSASLQCKLDPIKKPLRILLIMEDHVPDVVQSAFLNALRSIPDVAVTTAGPPSDVVIHVGGMETKRNGVVTGDVWVVDASRWWSCSSPSMIRVLDETFGFENISTSPPDRVDASVQEDVAELNVQVLEKLRQEGDAPHH